MCVITLCTRGALDTWSRGRSTAALYGAPTVGRASSEVHPVIAIPNKILLMTLTVAIVACRSEPSSPQSDSKDQWTLTSSFWFGDCEFMDTVAAALSDAGIDYRRGENASIVHRSEDSAAVHRIADDVLAARRMSGWKQGTTECKAKTDE
jgi:hypothetical protein